MCFLWPLFVSVRQEEVAPYGAKLLRKAKKGVSPAGDTPKNLFLLLAVYLVRNGEFLAALCATGGENATTIGGLHALTETVLVIALAIVRLECSFHFVLYRYNYYFLQMLTHSLRIRSAKVVRKPFPAKFSSVFFPFRTPDVAFFAKPVRHFLSSLSPHFVPVRKRFACSAMSSASSK